MSAQFADVSTHDVHQVKARVVGAEPRDVPYSRSGKRYQPERITVEYRRNNYGEWKPFRPKIAGHVLKKDGAVGLAGTEERYVAELPEWAARFVDTYRPAP